MSDAHQRRDDTHGWDVVEVEPLIDEMQEWLQQEMEEAVGGGYTKPERGSSQLAFHFAGRFRK